ncbi:hypothetical protein MMPV_005610 [Pyropia vietnamensis]
MAAATPLPPSRRTAAVPAAAATAFAGVPLPLGCRAVCWYRRTPPGPPRAAAAAVTASTPIIGGCPRGSGGVPVRHLRGLRGSTFHGAPPHPVTPLSFTFRPCLSPTLPPISLPVPLLGAAAATLSMAFESSLSVADDVRWRDVDSRVVSAVSKARGRRVTAADVAAGAGISMDDAQRELVALASITNGAMDVSEAGDLAWRFPKDVKAALLSGSARARLQSLVDTAWPLIYSGIRTGFGVLLLVSIVVTFVSIFALIAAASSSSGGDRDDRRRGGGGMVFLSPGRVFGPSPFDMFYYQPYGTYYGRRAARGAPVRPSGGAQEGDTNGMSFLQAVFSFVFGDGDPNIDLENRRWRRVAAAIRASDGAVSAVQLAPLLDLPANVEGDTPALSASAVDEQYMLPVLTRFDGHPEVTDEGDIVYVFPSLTTTASTGGRTELAGTASTGSSAYLQEKEYVFSEASPFQRLAAALLGGVNVVGALALGSLLSSVRTAALTPDGVALVSTISTLFPALAAYAGIYAIVPAVRVWWNRLRNRSIRERNDRRLRAARRLAGDREARRRVEGAAAYRQAKVIVGDADVVYSTDRETAEQIDPAVADFERRLGGK